MLFELFAVPEKKHQCPILSLQVPPMSEKRASSPTVPSSTLDMFLTDPASENSRKAGILKTGIFFITLSSPVPLHAGAKRSTTEIESILGLVLDRGRKGFLCEGVYNYHWAMIRAGLQDHFFGGQGTEAKQENVRLYPMSVHV